MTDWAKILRDAAGWYEHHSDDGETLRDAADEIDRLRTALREIAGREHMLGECWGIAERALGE